MHQSVQVIQSFDNADWSKPFVIRGVMDSWPAMQNWTFENFKKLYGERPVYVFRANASLNHRTHHTKMSFGAYIDYIISTDDLEPYYLVDWFVYQNLPEILDEYETPKPFLSWMRHLPYFLMPKFLSLYIGPRHSMSQLHFDIMNTVAWNACTVGEKEWYFYSPDETENLHDAKVNAFNPDLNKYPKFEQAKGYHHIQVPGDLIYTPAGWWHTVKNLSPSIALTDNFLNQINIKRFFTHFGPAAHHLIKRTWLRRKTPLNLPKEHEVSTKHSS